MIEEGNDGDDVPLRPPTLCHISSTHSSVEPGANKSSPFAAHVSCSLQGVPLACRPELASLRFEM